MARAKTYNEHYDITDRWWAERMGALGYILWKTNSIWVAVWPGLDAPHRIVFEGSRWECHEYIIARRLLDGRRADGLLGYPDNG